MTLPTGLVTEEERLNRPRPSSEHPRNWRRRAVVLGASALALFAGAGLLKDEKVPGKRVTYTVERGDTLFRIVDKYVVDGVDLRPIVDEVAEKVLPELGIEDPSQLKPGMEMSFEVPVDVYDVSGEDDESS